MIGRGILPKIRIFGGRFDNRFKCWLNCGVNAEVNISYCPPAVNGSSGHHCCASELFSNHNATMPFFTSGLKCSNCMIARGELRKLGANEASGDVSGSANGQGAEPVLTGSGMRNG